MTWIQATWLAAGVLLGIAHAEGTWRTARRPSAATAVFGIARLLAIGLALTVAAVLGGILPAAAGWAAGFFTHVAVRSQSRQTLASRIDHSQNLTNSATTTSDFRCGDGDS